MRTCLSGKNENGTASVWFEQASSVSRSRIENSDQADFLDFGSRLARTCARNQRFRWTAPRSR